METPRQPHSSHCTPSPSRTPWQQEKQDLGNLNDRLATYIEKVNASPQGVGAKPAPIYDVKKTYETEFADARKKHDRVAKERAQLQQELSNLKELSKRSANKEAELDHRLRDLEALLNSKEAALSAALSETHKLEAELRDVKAQLLRLEGSLTDTSQLLQDEELRRMDAENRLQTLREEIEFQKCLHKQELHELDEEMKKRLMEENTMRQVAFDRKLEELRQQQQEQLSTFRNKMEKTYHIKLESACLSADEKNHHLIGAAHKELQQTCVSVEELSAQLGQLQQQLSAQEATLRCQEAALSQECDLGRRRLRDKDLEIQQQVNEFQELLVWEPALKMEIKAYRKLLEGEEERLCLSPGASAEKRPAGSSHSSKRRRCSDGEPSSQAGATVSRMRIRQQASARGRITVDKVDLDGKFIRFSNMADKDQSLNGWQVRRELGSGSPIVYNFPQKFTLKAGASVTVWAANGGGTHSPPTDLVWRGQSSWGSGNVLQTVLISTSGEEMDKRKVTRTLFVDEDDAADTGAQSGSGGSNEYNLRRRTPVCSGGLPEGVPGQSCFVGSDGPRQGRIRPENCSIM